jgi:P-type Mg2+ transporter
MASIARAPARRSVLGFVAPPAFYFLILAGVLLFYLLAVEGMRQWFFHHIAAE